MFYLRPEGKRSLMAKVSSEALKLNGKEGVSGRPEVPLKHSQIMGPDDKWRKREQTCPQWVNQRRIGFCP